MFFSFSSLFSPLFVAWNFPSVVSWGLLESSRVTVPLEQARFSFGISQEKVSLPTDNPTLSFWTHGENNANPLATEGSEGPLSDDIDIAIIGSGITGVSLAYHLSQSLQLLNSPLKIAVLEARNFCSGATGRNGGHLAPTVFQGFHQNELKYGTAEAQRFLALENHTTHALLSFMNQEQIAEEIDLVHGYRVKFLLSDKEKEDLEADFKTANASHVDLTSVQFLSSAETSISYGPDYPSVKYFAHNLWPLKLVTKLFLAARRHVKSMDNGSKLILHTHTPILEAISANPKHDGVLFPKRWNLRTPRGDIRTSIVIHATNAYTVRGQVIATKAAVSAGHFKRGSYDANDGFEYWFSRPVKNFPVDQPLVILGGGRESAGPNYEIGVADDSTVNPNVSKSLREFLPHLYPNGWFPENRTPEMEWTGIMGFTQSSLPVVGPVMNYTDGTFLEGQYVSAGYTGHGMPRASGCAEALVQMIISDILHQDWNPPSWFPSRYLTTFS